MQLCFILAQALQILLKQALILSQLVFELRISTVMTDLYYQAYL